MLALVSIETVLLVILVVLVAGLLRSHAEILRRLGSAGEGPAIPQPAARDRQPGTAAARPIAGQTLQGDAVSLDFSGADGPPTLLAFLSSGCSVCGSFWERLGERRLPDGVQKLIITHGPERESPSRLHSLAPAGVAVVMSSAAWSDYRVPGSPYFVLLQGGVRGEGSASSWEGLASLVGDAIADEGLTSGPVRARRVDERLTAAGIGVGHPSLYPNDR